MSSYKVGVNVANSGNYVFPGTKAGDLIFNNMTSNGAFHYGDSSNVVYSASGSNFRIASDTVTVEKNLNVMGSLLQNGVAFSGTGTSNVAYSASNRAYNSLPLSGGTLTGNLSLPSMTLGGTGPFKMAYGQVLWANGNDLQTISFNQTFNIAPHVMTCWQQPAGASNTNAIAALYIVSVSTSNFVVRAASINYSQTTSGDVSSFPNGMNVNWMAIGL